MALSEKSKEVPQEQTLTPEELKHSPITIPDWINQSDKYAAYKTQFELPEEKNEWRKFGKYLPQVRRIFKEHGIPEELVYIAFTESCCDPAAVNGMAVGIFQLKEDTAERFGLKVVPHYIDERKSVLHAAKTTAGILSEIYDLTFTWGTIRNEQRRWCWAILGFNLGKEGIEKKYKKHHGDIKAYLESQDATEEQKNYLHRFFGAREVFNPMREEEPQTPQLEEAHVVYRQQKKTIVYTIEQGDNLTKIAKNYNKTIPRIIAFNLQKNPAFDPDNLTIGQEILIPQIPAATIKYSDILAETGVLKSDFDELNLHLESEIVQNRKGIPETTICFPAEQDFKNLFYDRFENQILNEAEAEEEICDRETCFEEARRKY